MTTGLNSFSTNDEAAVPEQLHGNGGAEPAMPPIADDGSALDQNGAEDRSGTDRSANDDSWRGELAARLERYRTRRKPRSPRYPSLLLPFDAPESRLRSTFWSGSGQDGPGGKLETGDQTAVAAPSSERSVPSSFFLSSLPPNFLPAKPEYSQSPASRDDGHSYPEPIPEVTGRILEFPRCAAIPVFHANELAEPVIDRPRIVEAPEILPPPPALGGMLIEPARREVLDRRGDDALPGAPASIGRRVLAALVDGAVVGTAVGGFATIFSRLTQVRGPLLLLLTTFGSVAIALWMAYTFLILVYTGSTPGLRAAGLRLSGFNGKPVNRRLRRWRALASFLSALSVGLGYIWCALDQDGLCWHDRITRTYLQRSKSAAHGPQ
jgi:uncharacterized RDD family membrane protein YckC